MISQELKLSATHFGLDPNSFGTRSLRMGGPSEITAAGFSNEEVRKQGAWVTEKNANKYIRKIGGVMDKTSGLRHLSISDLKRMQATVKDL